MPSPHLCTSYLISREMILKQGCVNVHQLPMVESLIIHKRLSKSAPSLESEALRLHLLTGRKPKLTRAKRSNAKFGIRKGDPLGCKVSLRGKQADRFLHFFTFGMCGLSKMYTIRTNGALGDQCTMAFGLGAETHSAEPQKPICTTNFEGCIHLSSKGKRMKAITYLSAFLI